MVPPDEDGDGDLPTLLMLGTGDPLCAALEEALGGYATFVEAAPSEAPTSSVLAAAPDLVVLLGDAAEQAESILRELSENAATAVVPIAILSENASLDARLRFSRHGAVAVVPKSASLDEMARRIAALAQELPDRSGSMLGEVGEATVDELVELLSAEVKSGILSIAPAGAEEGARVVLRSGRPVAEAISDFVDRIRPLVESSEPLRYEFHESPTGRLDVLDADTMGSTDPGVLVGRRVLLVEEKVARADMLAQELRASGAQVVVTDGAGEGLARARALDPELLLVNEDGLDGWAYGVMSQLRRDAGLRWASVLVVREEELWADESAPPRLDRLVAGVSALLAADLELTARAKNEKRFDIRLETLGPVRTLRAIARAGLTHHLTVRHPRAMVEVDIAEGLIAGAEATLMGNASRRAAGPEALATLLVLSAGRIRVEQRDRPAAANMLAPVDDAVAAARRETPPLKPSLPPPAPTIVPAESRLGGAGGDATALVERLEGLLSRLEERLPGEAHDSEAPTSTRKAVAARIPPPPRAPAMPKPAPTPRPLERRPVWRAEETPRASAARGGSARGGDASASSSRDGPVMAPLPPVNSGDFKPVGALDALPKPPPPPKPLAPPPSVPQKAPAPTLSVTSPSAPAAERPSADEAVAVGVPTEERETQEPLTAPAAPPLALVAPVVAPPPSPPAAPLPTAPDLPTVPGSAPDAAGDRPANADELTLPRSGPSPLLLVGGLAALLLMGLGYGVYRAVASDGEDSTAGAPVMPVAQAQAGDAGAVAVAMGPADSGSGRTAIVTPDAGAMRDAGRPADAAADAMTDARPPEANPLDPATTDALADGNGLEGAPGDGEADDGEVEPGVQELGLPRDRAGRIGALLRAGNFQRHAGRRRVASARYRAVLRLDRNNGRAMAGLARVELANHRNAEAIRWARRLVRSHPQQASNRVLLGDALAAAGNRAGAQRAWRAALTKDPQHRGALRRLGRR